VKAFVRRIELPSGKVIEVTYFDDEPVDVRSDETNFADGIERFAHALDVDAILPEDF
jgi:hypothetical protein